MTKNSINLLNFNLKILFLITFTITISSKTMIYSLFNRYLVYTVYIVYTVFMCIHKFSEYPIQILTFS